MSIDLVLPRLSMTMDEAEIVEWLKREGDPVKKGDPVLVITTDKANMDVVAEADGVLANVRAKPGETVAVGSVIAQIVDAVTPTQPSVKASPVAQRIATAHGIDLATIHGSGPRGQVMEADVRAAMETARPVGNSFVRATPYARLLAAQSNIPLAQVASSHYTGRVVARDVKKFLAEHQAQAQPPQPELVAKPIAPTVLPPTQVRATTPFAGIRATIARRMVASTQSTAPVTLTTEADATLLVEARNRLKNSLQQNNRLTPRYNDLFIKAVALALEEYPALNARLNGDQIEQLDEINIGLAVDTARGLLVPVVRNVGKLGLQTISRLTSELADRAQKGTCTPAELTGGTFTITNLGIYEIDVFTPIINLPETAILGVGRIREKIVPWQGQPSIRSTVWLSLTFDHRLVDGAPAARFLQHIKRLIEEPLLLLG